MTTWDEIKRIEGKRRKEYPELGSPEQLVTTPTPVPIPLPDPPPEPTAALDIFKGAQRALSTLPGQATRVGERALSALPVVGNLFRLGKIITEEGPALREEIGKVLQAGEVSQEAVISGLVKLGMHAQQIPLVERVTENLSPNQKKVLFGASANDEEQQRSSRSWALLQQLSSASPEHRDIIMDELQEVFRDRPLWQQGGPGALDVPLIGLAVRPIKFVSKLARQFRPPPIPIIQGSAPTELIRHLQTALHNIREISKDIRKLRKAETGKRFIAQASEEKNLLQQGVHPQEAFEISHRALTGPLATTDITQISKLLAATKNRQNKLLDKLGYENDPTRISDIRRQLDDVDDQIKDFDNRLGIGENTILAQLKESDVQELITIVSNRKPGNLTETFNNKRAFYRLFGDIETPQPGDIRRMEEILGTEVVNEIVRIRRMGPGIWDRITDIINLPRAMAGSNDLASMGRQGRILGNRRPAIWWASGRAGLKAMGSDSNARAIMEGMRKHPRWNLITDSVDDGGLGIEMTEFGRGVRLTSKEEGYMTNMSAYIPWVRVSERGYVTQINRIRWDTANGILDDWEAGGKVLTASNRLWLGRYINWTSGRGPLPEGLKSIAAILNAVFWSTRLQTGRLATPYLLLHPATRGMIAKDLASVFSTNAVILGGLVTAGVATVEWDYRSSDYLKARFEETRHDYWLGYQQYAVLAGRIWSGEKIAFNQPPEEAWWGETVLNFLQYKFSPGFGVGVQTVTGRTPFGEPLTWKQLRDQLGEYSLGISIASILEGVKQAGWVHGWLNTPDLAGISTSSYSTLAQIKNDSSMEEFGIPYNDLTDDKLEKMGSKLTAFEAMEKIDQLPKTQSYIDDLSIKRGTATQQLEANYTPQEQLQVGTTLRVGRNIEHVAALRKVIDEGTTGRTLRKAIQNFKALRRETFKSTTSPEAEERLEKRSAQSMLLKFRNDYWSADPEEKFVDGTFWLDFDVRDDAQDKVLALAAAEGIKKESIEARPSKRFDDAEVRRVVEEYEAAIEYMRPYFGVARRLIPDDNMYAQYISRPKHEWTRQLKVIAKEVRKKRKKMLESRTLKVLLIRWGFMSDPKR